MQTEKLFIKTGLCLVLGFHAHLLLCITIIELYLEFLKIVELRIAVRAQAIFNPLKVSTANQFILFFRTLIPHLESYHKSRV